MNIHKETSGAPLRKKGKQNSQDPKVVEAPDRGSAPGAVQTSYPTVALVGRPNVGKSSIFNQLLRQELSITDARAGTTRDRVLHPIEFCGKPCDLMDTGGIGIVDKQQLSEEIESQIQKAIYAATVLVMVVDAQDGLTPLDREVVARLGTRFTVTETVVESAIENIEFKLPRGLAA